MVAVVFAVDLEDDSIEIRSLQGRGGGGAKVDPRISSKIKNNFLPLVDTQGLNNFALGAPGHGQSVVLEFEGDSGCLVTAESAGGYIDFEFESGPGTEVQGPWKVQADIGIGSSLVVVTQDAGRWVDCIGLGVVKRLLNQALVPEPGPGAGRSFKRVA